MGLVSKMTCSLGLATVREDRERERERERERGRER